MQGGFNTVAQFSTTAHEMDHYTADPTTITVSNSMEYFLELDSLHEYDVSEQNFMDVEQPNGPCGSKKRGIDDVDSTSQFGGTNIGAGGHKPGITGTDYDSSAKASKSPTSSHKRKTAGIESETESERSESSTRRSKSKMHDVESESYSVVNEELSRSCKRKKTDIESESESEENEAPTGNHKDSHDKNESRSERDATANDKGMVISANFDLFQLRCLSPDPDYMQTGHDNAQSKAMRSSQCSSVCGYHVGCTHRLYCSVSDRTMATKPSLSKVSS